MIHMFGHLSDLDKVSIENEAIYDFIKGHLTILDNEYGGDRDVDEDDGGYILYCEHGTTHDELSCMFEYEEAICEYTEKGYIDVDLVNDNIIYKLPMYCSSIFTDNFIDRCNIPVAKCNYVHSCSTYSIPPR